MEVPKPGDEIHITVNESNETAVAESNANEQNLSDKKLKQDQNEMEESLKRPYIDEEDDGSTCPICLEPWEINGDHKLVSLKCGHLFGNSCISRWLNESPIRTRSCPACKTRANTREVRQIFARSVVSVDRVKLKNLKIAFAKEHFEIAIQNIKIQQMEETIDKLRKQLVPIYDNTTPPTQRGFYKLYVDNNVEVSQDDGCRVMQYCSAKRVLYCSQKFRQKSFVGHGIRYLDVPTMIPTDLLHVSQNEVCDMKLNQKDGTMIAASRNRNAILIDVNCKNLINTIKPDGNSIVWSCGFDKMDRNRILLGNQTGTIFSFDIRRFAQMEASCSAVGDTSPVLQICPLDTVDGVLPYGGILVCKLQNLWLFEYRSVIFDVQVHRLNVTGPFSCLTLSKNDNLILVSTRPCEEMPIGRLITGLLKRVEGEIIFETHQMFYGSKLWTKKTNSAIANMGSADTIVATYLEDAHKIVTWNVRSGVKMQCLTTDEMVFDLQTLYLGESVYFAALTGKKCGLYKIVQANDSE